MKFVTTADMKAGTQRGHRIIRTLAPSNRIVGKHQMHEVIQIDVGFQAEVSVPQVEPITRRGAAEVDSYFFRQQLALR